MRSSRLVSSHGCGPTDGLPRPRLARPSPPEGRGPRAVGARSPLTESPGLLGGELAGRHGPLRCHGSQRLDHGPDPASAGPGALGRRAGPVAPGEARGRGNPHLRRAQSHRGDPLDRPGPAAAGGRHHARSPDAGAPAQIPGRAVRAPRSRAAVPRHRKGLPGAGPRWCPGRLRRAMTYLIVAALAIALFVAASELYSRIVNRKRFEPLARAIEEMRRMATRDVTRRPAGPDDLAADMIPLYEAADRELREQGLTLLGDLVELHPA